MLQFIELGGNSVGFLELGKTLFLLDCSQETLDRLTNLDLLSNKTRLILLLSKLPTEDYINTIVTPIAEHLFNLSISLDIIYPNAEQYKCTLYNIESAELFNLNGKNPNLLITPIESASKPYTWSYHLTYKIHGTTCRAYINNRSHLSYEELKDITTPNLPIYGHLPRINFTVRHTNKIFLLSNYEYHTMLNIQKVILANLQSINSQRNIFNTFVTITEEGYNPIEITSAVKTYRDTKDIPCLLIEYINGQIKKNSRMLYRGDSVYLSQLKLNSPFKFHNGISSWTDDLFIALDFANTNNAPDWYFCEDEWVGDYEFPFKECVDNSEQLVPVVFILRSNLNIKHIQTNEYINIYYDTEYLSKDEHEYIVTTVDYIVTGIEKVRDLYMVILDTPEHFNESTKSNIINSREISSSSTFVSQSVKSFN